MNNYSSQTNRRLRPRSARGELRQWQMKFKECYAAARQREFLMTAAPGTGKSTATAEVARDLFEKGVIERIVVVAPSEHLKFQWAKTFHQLGIDLDPNWSNASCAESSDYHGVVVTYAQVSAEPDIYDFNCKGQPTMVVFDEIHHPAVGLDWGDKLRCAFGSAVRILGLSGTPFRHDKNWIPFVRYDNEGKSISDFSYSYEEALADRVCRPIIFPTFEGSASWYDGYGNWKSQTEFSGLSRTKAGELLRVLLLDEKGGWLRPVLREANNKLSEFRAAGHSDAAGLVIEIDQKHARKIAKLLKQITGDEATIVISEDPDSGRALHEFARDGSSRRWIVAVKMVSEGIDILRLRVGVYASTTLTELAFRQAVGRFVRIIAGLGEQNAAFYMPAHPALVRYALAIKVERDHVLGFHSYPIRSSNQAIATGVNGQPGGSGNPLVDTFLTGNSERADSFAAFDEDGTPVFNDSFVGSPAANVMPPGSANNSGGVPFSRQILVTIKSEARFEQTIYDGEGFSDLELKLAEQHAGQCGLIAPPKQLAAFLRVATGAAGGVTEGSGVGNGNDNEPDKYAAQPNSAAVSLPNPVRTAAPTGASDVKKYSAPLAEPPMLLHERKKLLRDLINKTENRLAGFSGKKPGNFHSVWAREMNEKPQSVASVADLERKLAWLNEQMDRISRRE